MGDLQWTASKPCALRQDDAFCHNTCCKPLSWESYTQGTTRPPMQARDLHLHVSTSAISLESYLPPAPHYVSSHLRDPSSVPTLVDLRACFWFANLLARLTAYLDLKLGSLVYRRTLGTGPTTEDDEPTPNPCSANHDWLLMLGRTWLCFVAYPYPCCAFRRHSRCLSVPLPST